MLPEDAFEPDEPPAVISQSSRTAFTLGAVHKRRDAARITAVAVDARLHRLFLGLSTGLVEEHQLLHGTGLVNSRHDPHHQLPHAQGSPGPATGTRLVSGRKVFRQGVADVCCLPVAQKVVARSQDGNVTVCLYEGAELFPASSLKNAIAIAGDVSGKTPARLAAACKSGVLTSGGAASRLVVCSLGAGPGGMSGTERQVQVLAQISIQEPILGIAWAGDNVLLALPQCYRIVASGGVCTDIAAHTCPHPLIAPISVTREAMILASDTMVVVVNSHGVAASAPLLLGSFPLALACVDQQLLAVTDEGVEVHDRLEGSRLQSIPFIHDDAWVQASRKLPCCHDWALGHVMFATSNTLYCLAPVSPEAQVHELLKKRNYAGALSLITAQCEAARGAPGRMTSQSGAPPAAATQHPPEWCYAAVAQAAVMLTQEARFLPALMLLLHLPTHIWQPCQLLHLFPNVTSRWLPECPSPPTWNQHRMSRDLHQLIVDHLELRSVTQLSITPPSTSPGGSTHSHSEEDVQRVMHVAHVLIAAYILQVRQQPGVRLLEALDTLSVHLLIKTGLVGQLEALLAASDCAAAPQETANMCKQANRWHALALMYASRGQAEDALATWEQLGTCAVQEDTQHCQPSSPQHCLPVTDILHTFLHLTRTLTQPSTAATGPSSNASDLLHVSDMFESAVQLEGRLMAGSDGGELGGSGGGGGGGGVPALPHQHATFTAFASRQGVQGDAVSENSASGIIAAQSNQAALAAASIAALMCVTQVTASPKASLVPEPLSRVQQLHITASRSSSVSGAHHLGSEVITSAGQWVPRGSAAARAAHASSLNPATSGKLLAHTASMSLAATWSDASCTGVVLPAVPVPRDPVQPDLVLKKLPWLLKQYPGEALKVLTGRADLPRAQVETLLQASQSTDVRWMFLHTQLYQQRPTTLPPPDAQAASTHLALQLVQCIGKEWSQGQPQAPQGQPPTGAGQSVAAVGAGHELPGSPMKSIDYIGSTSLQSVDMNRSGSQSVKHPSGVAHMHSGALSTDKPAPTDRLNWLQSVLMHHLEMSTSYDARAVLDDVQSTCPGGLLREQVVLFSRLRDHSSALQTLVVRLKDVSAGIRYCRQQQQVVEQQAAAARQAGGQQEGGSTAADQASVEVQVEQLWMTLLEWCLRPGEGQEPMYAAALRVLAVPSLSVGLTGGPPPMDPLKVLAALPDAMPLSLATPTLSTMMISTAHRKRHVQVLKGLYRTQNLELRAQVNEQQAQRVIVTDATTCHACHRPLGTRVFVREPNGFIKCGRCASLETTPDMMPDL